MQPLLPTFLKFFENFFVIFILFDQIAALSADFTPFQAVCAKKAWWLRLPDFFEKSPHFMRLT